MRDSVSLHLLIHGRFDADSFCDWVSHRASILDLRGWVKPSAQSAEISVTGHEVLVDAFEIACSLGPGDALIDRIDRTPGNQSEAQSGFVRLLPLR